MTLDRVNAIGRLNDFATNALHQAVQPWCGQAFLVADGRLVLRAPPHCVGSRKRQVGCRYLCGECRERARVFGRPSMCVRNR